MRLAFAAVTALLAVSEAQAHGPCRCFRPDSGSPGTEVIIEQTNAFRVVWNERGDSLDRLYAEYYSPEAPSILLFRSAQPQKNVRFRVPDVPVGRYVVKVYDGSEGRQHYTWAFFEVSRASRLPWVVMAVAGAIVALLLIYGARRSMTQSSPSRR